MADNLTITPGSGATVRTDELAGSAHVQYVKIMDGIDGSETPIGATSGSLNTIVAQMPIGGYASPLYFVSGSTPTIADTNSVAVIAGEALYSLYINTIMVTNADASVGTFVNITDGSGGTVLWSGYAAPKAGWSVNLNVPIHTSTGSGIYAVCETTDAEVRVCASGYKA